jgi:hypothetical protein
MRVKSPVCDDARCSSPMLRTYVRPTGDDHKQRLVLIGWWCPECCNFTNELQHNTARELRGDGQLIAATAANRTARLLLWLWMLE